MDFYGKEVHGLKITLKAARVNAGLTQEEAAEKLGVSRDRLLRWENGITEPPYTAVINMCKVYGCSVDYLILPAIST